MMNPAFIHDTVK